jgi:hypothetical protein
MNWEWANSLDQLWRSPTLPMWVTLAAACFFALVLLITLFRAEKSVANGALTVITLLAVAVAVAATIRLYTPAGRAASAETPVSAGPVAALPALACIDDLAGDTVSAGCEKALFASPETTAAAVSYTASQVSRLTALGEAAADKRMTPELKALRRAIERDRYGFVAQVLTARDQCTPTECAAFRALTDSHQIVANMDEHLYEGLVARHALAWNAPPMLPGTVPLAALPGTLPSGKPTNAEFPTAASTPPVSIMAPEPPAGAAPPRPAQPAANPPAPPARPAPPAMAAAKKPPAKPAHPVQLTPAPAEPAPAAKDD